MKHPKRVALVAAAVACPVAFAYPVQAHTPRYEANCSGVYAEIVNTPDDFESTITIYVKGVDEQSSTALGDHSLWVGDMPQDGSFYDWAVDVDSPSGRFELHTSGQVGPCGELPTEEPTPTPEPTPEPTPTPPTPAPEPPSIGTPILPQSQPPNSNPPPTEQTYPEPYCLGVALVIETEQGKSYDNGNPACAGEDSREEGA